MTTTTTIIVVIVTIAMVVTIWRLASSRHSLPCPVWPRWLVEIDNPFTKTNRSAFIVETLALAPGGAGCRMRPGALDRVPLAQGVCTFRRVVALDIQAGILARAKTKNGGSGSCEYRLH